MGVFFPLLYHCCSKCFFLLYFIPGCWNSVTPLLQKLSLRCHVTSVKQVAQWSKPMCKFSVNNKGLTEFHSAYLDSWSCCCSCWLIITLSQLTGTSESNRAVVKVIGNICMFPAMTSRHVSVSSAKQDGEFWWAPRVQWENGKTAGIHSFLSTLSKVALLSIVSNAMRCFSWGGSTV